MTDVQKWIVTVPEFILDAIISDIIKQFRNLFRMLLFLILLNTADTLT